MASTPTGIYLKKQTYWLRWTPVAGGRQVRQSLGTRDLQEAITKAREVRLREAPRLQAAAESCTAEVERYLEAKAAEGLSSSTLASRRYVLLAFVAAVNAATPRHIGSAACARWFEERRAKHGHTAVAYLRQARWWIASLIERGVVVRDPTAGIVIPKLRMQARKAFLMPDQARQLLEACTDDGLKFAIFCGLHAGMRKLEIVEARPSWFDLENGLIHIQATETFQPKDRDNRTVPMTDELREWLRVYGLHEPFMLEPKAKHGRYRYRFDFRKSFDSLVLRCGLPDCTFHDLRRTFASLLVSKGVSLYKVAKWLGDELDTVQTHYGHLIPQDDQINASWS